MSSIELTICHPPNPSFVLKGVDSAGSTKELKQRLEKELVAVEGKVETVRLICSGRVLQDHLNLQSQGVTNLSKIYVSIPKIGENPSIASSTSSASATSAAANKNSTDDPLMAPLLKFLAANPELYQQMLLSNPQMQKLIEKNPELGHALSDPSTLKSMLNAAANPKAYNEMLRGHDRAMSNLENIPEGFSHLKRVYSTLQEPMYDAFTPQQQQQQQLLQSNLLNNVTTTATTRKDPIPNPWAPKKPPSVLPPSSSSIFTQRRQTSPTIFGFNAQKRKLQSSFDAIDENHDEMNDLLLNSMQRAGLSSPSSLRDRFFTELEAMHALGFDKDEEENIPALMETGGNVTAAIDRILFKRKQREE